MTRRERRSAFGLLARQGATDAPLAAIVAIIVAICAFLVATAPGALAEVSDREVRHTLEGFSAPRHDLTASAYFGRPGGSPFGNATERSGIDEITGTVEGVVPRLTPPLGAVLSDSEWTATTTRTSATSSSDTGQVAPNLVGLTAAPRWEEVVTFVQGTRPAPPTEESVGAPVEIALSVAASERMGIGIGDVLALPFTPLLVTGLYEPTDAGDPFWEHRPYLRDAVESRNADGRLIYVVDVLIDPESTVALREPFATARIDAWYTLQIDEVRFVDVPRLAEQIRELSSGTVQLFSGENLIFDGGLAADLDDVSARVALTTALLAMLISGPLGVILAVLALAVGSIADRRSAAFALARARGASGLQLRITMMLEGVLLAVPAAALGAAAAFAVTGGRTAIEDLWPVVLIAAIPPLLFALAVPPPAARERPPRARWIVEVLVIGLAAASLFLLFRRGIAPTGAGIDPLLAAAPLLVAAAVTIGVLRLYPWMMAAAQRAAGRGRGAVGLVGSARAVRAPSLGFAAAFALVVGVAVAVFSAGMAASLSRALALASDPATRGEIAPLDAGHPIVAAVFAFLSAAAGLPLLLCVVAVVLAVIAAARSRNRTVGVLRVLGFSAAQVRGLVAWELVPVVIVAIVAGVALGAVDVVVLGTALDLAAFAGAKTSVAPGVDLAVTAGIAVVFAGATALAAAAATNIARRRTPGSRIRMGME
ncbi:FtsX-like permease family protein [Microbacterium sp.]|uniref:FtsX-like permease family protein n=1 Tax=Microbacterium sp. TaxID=51671 RepID=UPI003F713954